MLKNHLTIALRSIVRDRGYTAINLFGLAVGLSCFTIIMLYVHDELSYDRFHHDAELIHRVVVDQVEPDGSILHRTWTPDALGAAIPLAIPEVAQAARVMGAYWGKKVLRYEDKEFYDDNYLLVDSTFFDVFSFSFVRGSSTDALTQPGAVVLTESLARILFGDEEAMGKTLLMDKGKELVVTAVVEDVPLQSHFRFGFLLPLSTTWQDCWDTSCGHAITYVKVHPGADLSALEDGIGRLVRANRQEVTEDVFYTQPLVGLNGIHLTSHRQFEFEPNTDRLHIGVMLAVALFTLMIAGVNYVNLATARSALRANEIGVRKAVGAHRKSLVQQFLIESVLISSAAGGIAVGLTQLALPFFNDIVQRELSLLDWESVVVWSSAVGATLILGIVSGIYPSLYLSAFKPVAILGNRLSGGRSHFGLRKALVVFQFALAALVMVGALTIRKQLDYIQSSDLGFDTDQVLVVNLYKAEKLDMNFVVRDALSQVTGVAEVGAARGMVGLFGDGLRGTIKAIGAEDGIGTQGMVVDYNYFSVMGHEFVEGRPFSRQFETATDKSSVILNETAVRRLALTGPVLGQQIVDDGGRAFEIVGVVKDFHSRSLHGDIVPFAFYFTPAAVHGVLRLEGGRLNETMAQIEATWERLVPNWPMDYYFLDDEIDQLYRAEQSFGALFAVMSGISLLVAGLGMIGLGTFAAQRRTREIGVRKVLGASVASVVGLLSREFTQLIVLANLIAWPVAYWVMGLWLQEYAYHTEIEASVFATAGSIALVAAAVAVGGQALRAALANPVDSLRSK